MGFRMRKEIMPYDDDESLVLVKQDINRALTKKSQGQIDEERFDLVCRMQFDILLMKCKKLDELKRQRDNLSATLQKDMMKSEAGKIEQKLILLTNDMNRVDQIQRDPNLKVALLPSSERKKIRREQSRNITIAWWAFVSTGSLGAILLVSLGVGFAMLLFVVLAFEIGVLISIYDHNDKLKPELLDDPINYYGGISTKRVVTAPREMNALCRRWINEVGCGKIDEKITYIEQQLEEIGKLKKNYDLFMGSAESSVEQAHTTLVSQFRTTIDELKQRQTIFSERLENLRNVKKQITLLDTALGLNDDFLKILQDDQENYKVRYCALLADTSALLLHVDKLVDGALKNASDETFSEKLRTCIESCEQSTKLLTSVV